MTKNARGYIFVNYNGSISNITTTVTGVVSPTAVSVSNNMQFVSTCPDM